VSNKSDKRIAEYDMHDIALLCKLMQDGNICKDLHCRNCILDQDIRFINNIVKEGKFVEFLTLPIPPQSMGEGE